MPRRPGGTPAVVYLLARIDDLGVVNADGVAPTARKIERTWQAGLGPKVSGNELPDDAVVAHYAKAIPLTGRGRASDWALVTLALSADLAMLDEQKVREAWLHLFTRFVNDDDGDLSPDALVNTATAALARGTAPMHSALLANLRRAGPFTDPDTDYGEYAGAPDPPPTAKQLFEEAMFGAAGVLQNELPRRPEVLLGAIAPGLVPAGTDIFDADLMPFLSSLGITEGCEGIITDAPLAVLVAAANAAHIMLAYGAYRPLQGREQPGLQRVSVVFMGPKLLAFKRDSPVAYDAFMAGEPKPLGPFDEDVWQHFRELRETIETWQPQPNEVERPDGA